MWSDCLANLRTIATIELLEPRYGTFDARFIDFYSSFFVPPGEMVHPSSETRSYFGGVIVDERR